VNVIKAVKISHLLIYLKSSFGRANQQGSCPKFEKAASQQSTTAFLHAFSAKLQMEAVFSLYVCLMSEREDYRER
jgi:hypothetical protein